MATELAQGYVQIIPTTKGIQGKISKEFSGEGEAAGASMGKKLIGGLGAVVAAAGIGKMFADTIGEAGNLQQSFGGLDTLYGDAAEAAKNYAAEAAKMGISANRYAEQAVSFGAALKSAYGGDTVAAAEAANKAITQMADNSAKMGTDISSVEQAYQGFAKGQYQLLDNLKLGYGGTKTEMERLLADAEKFSGVKYDINNLGDVYSAIGVIQEELGIAGVAAEEAKTTLTGSFAAMEAAGKNLMGNLALGEDITTELNVLTESFFTWAKNLVPLIGNVLKGLPTVLNTVMGEAVNGLNILAGGAGGLVNSGIQLVADLTAGIVSAIPSIAAAGWNLFFALGAALVNADWAGIISNMMNTIKTNLSTFATSTFGTDTGILDAIGTGIVTALPAFMERASEIINSLVNGIITYAPMLAEGAINIINSLFDFIMTYGPTIIESGITLIGNLITGIGQAIPSILISIGQVGLAIIKRINEHGPQMLQGGIVLIGRLVVGLINAIPRVLSAIGTLGKRALNALKTINWAQAGSDLVNGIINGLSQAGGALLEAVRGLAEQAFASFKSFFKIGSPSKLMESAAEWLPIGAAQGVEARAQDFVSSIRQMGIDAANSFDPQLVYTQQATVTPGASNNSDILAALQTLIDKDTNTTVVLEGDAARVWRLVKRENNKMTKSVGVNLLTQGV